MEVIQTKTPAGDAGLALGKLLQKYQDRQILLLLSGGSSLSLLPFISADSFSPSLTISLIDERCALDDSTRNLPKLEATNFFKSAMDRGASLLAPAVGARITCANVARDWEEKLRQWYSINSDGVTLATLGVGPDGHLAGMFPGDYGVDFSDNAWVVSYSVPATVNPFTDRITVTQTFLINQVTEAVVYVVGEEKRTVINLLGRGGTSLEHLPARILSEMPSVQLFTDII